MSVGVIEGIHGALAGTMRHYEPGGSVFGEPVAMNSSANRLALLLFDQTTREIDRVWNRSGVVELQVHLVDTEPLAQDDDGGDDVNAFLLFTPEESGDYIVRATSAGEERTLGSYQLRVGEKP